MKERTIEREPRMSFDVYSLWEDVLSQNKDALPRYFCDEAVIRWHCTNECFSIAEYVRANCEYPGNWKGEIERIERVADQIITVVQYN